MCRRRRSKAQLERKIIMSEITSKKSLPDFCKVGNKIGLALYKQFAAYPIYKILEIKNIKILKTKIVFTFTNDEQFESSIHYYEAEQYFSGKSSSNSKLFEIVDGDGFITKVNLQNTYNKLMAKVTKMNEHRVGLDGYGFKEMNLNDGNVETKEKCIEILDNISNQIDELAKLLEIE